MKLFLGLTLAAVASTVPSVTAVECPTPIDVDYGEFSGNTHCSSIGGQGNFGYEFGWKLDSACVAGTYLLTDTSSLPTIGPESGASCTPSGIEVTIACTSNDNEATISWTGAGNAQVDVIMKAGNGLILYEGINGATYTTPENKEISHINICVQCDDCGGEMMGEPHIKSWGNEWFDYMGECDLNLAHVPKFDGEKDLNIHARTTIEFGYSYIESAALQIGDDILEVNSWGEHSFNGVEGAEIDDIDEAKTSLRKNTKISTIGGYPIYHTAISKKNHVFDVVLGDRENITISNMKKFVNVKTLHVNPKHFQNVQGLLGSYDGKMVARDGVTDLHDDINAMGQEWQVRDDEPMLFRTIREPQYPAKCRLPDAEAKEARRLGEGISEEAAETACAHFKNQPSAFANCVYDVTATNDLDLADGGAY